LLGQGGVQFAGELLLLSQGGRHLFLDRLGEAIGQAQGPVVAADGIFDFEDRQVGQIAATVLTAPAEVIAVALPVAAPGLGVDQTGGAAGLVAALAVQVALQVVREDTVALATARAGVEYLLHPVEQLLADDRRMAAFDELALDLHPAGVVGVTQHLVQLVG
jgi:hypothetical protein